MYALHLVWEHRRWVFSVTCHFLYHIPPENAVGFHRDFISVELVVGGKEQGLHYSHSK